MATPLFIATERFDSSDGEKWDAYCRWAKIPGLIELISLDGMLCPRVVKELRDEDWRHTVCEDYRVGYFYHLEYLKKRVQEVSRKNILGLYRNPESHIVHAPGSEAFSFSGYDLIEEQTHISALTNCGGFPDVFRNDELNHFGLITSFDRSCEVWRLLAERYPEEPHAQCEMYAVWRLDETEPTGADFPQRLVDDSKE